jgi:hypothetical protein
MVFYMNALKVFNSLSVLIVVMASCQGVISTSRTQIDINEFTPTSTNSPSPIPSNITQIVLTATKIPPTCTLTQEPSKTSTITSSPTLNPSPTLTPTATAATLSEAVQHLDTPEKLSAFLLENITFTEHGGCLSYWPDIFYKKREGNCKDYSTFASYVLAQHGYCARRIVYTFYRNGVRLGHEVAAYEVDGQTWIMSNGLISGPFDSLNEYFKSLTWLDFVTLRCIKPPGGVTCCHP